GPAMNSEFLNGLHVAEAKQKIIGWLEERGIGKRRVNYKLRDRLFSRQRYWGEPFPGLHELGAGGEPTRVVRRLETAALPVLRPGREDFKPTGSPEGPLSKATDWVNVTIDGKRYRRETNTMPQWAGSCWYFLRYIDPKNPNAFADPAKLKYWLPVDLYVGGAEHAVLHLLYARFWHKVLFDRGYLPCPEPFQRLVNQGMILGEMAYTGFQKAKMVGEVVDEGTKTERRVKKLVPTGDWVSGKRVDFDGDFARMDDKSQEELACVKLDEEQVTKQGDAFVLKDKPDIRVDARAYKMSKSRGNVVNPDDIIKEYGADSLRLYEMFMGPLEAVKPWSTRSVEGVYRFLSRAWRLVVDDTADQLKLHPAVKDAEPDKDTLRAQHRTIQKVTEDTAGLRFNTAIAAMMEFEKDYLRDLKVRPRSVLEPFVLLL